MTVRATFLFPEPSDGGWRFTPTPAQRQQCVEVLQRWGVITGEPVHHDNAIQWHMGDGVDHLGLHWHGAGSVCIEEAEDIYVRVSPGPEISCEVCGEPIDIHEWNEAMNELCSSADVTRLHCRCEQGCSVENAVDPVGIVLARFVIRLEPASGAIQNQEFLRQISDALGGTPLRTCGYHL